MVRIGEYGGILFACISSIGKTLVLGARLVFLCFVFKKGSKHKGGFGMAVLAPGVATVPLHDGFPSMLS